MDEKRSVKMKETSRRQFVKTCLYCSMSGFCFPSISLFDSCNHREKSPPSPDLFEKEEIDVLLINQVSRKDFQKQRNSGFNHIIAKLAKKKNVTIGIPCSGGKDASWPRRYCSRRFYYLVSGVPQPFWTNQPPRQHHHRYSRPPPMI